MNIKNINFEWLSRLGKVVLIIISILSIPIIFFVQSDSYYDQPLSMVFLYTALFLSLTYICLILTVKILNYIVTGKSFIKNSFTKRHYLFFAMPIIIFTILGLIFLVVVEPSKNAKIKNKLEKEFYVSISKIETLRSQLADCLQPVRDTKYNEELKTCNLLKNKIKQDYNFCTTLAPVTSSASCLYDNNFEQIDCSEKTLRDKVNSKLTMIDMPQECSPIFEEFQANNNVIQDYNKLNKDK